VARLETVSPSCCKSGGGLVVVVVVEVVVVTEEVGVGPDVVVVLEVWFGHNSFSIFFVKLKPKEMLSQFRCRNFTQNITAHNKF
jgi:hypothetical protein